jgi:hypothetical protein
MIQYCPACYDRLEELVDPDLMLAVKKQQANNKRNSLRLKEPEYPGTRKLAVSQNLDR